MRNAMPNCESKLNVTCYMFVKKGRILGILLVVFFELGSLEMFVS